jgi:hypothetical protein
MIFVLTDPVVLSILARFVREFDAVREMSPAPER